MNSCGKIGWSLTFLMLGSIVLFGQDTYNLPPMKFYEKASIGLTNFEKLEVRNLSMLKDSLTYEWQGEKESLHLNEINYIRVREGSRAKGGALIGGASMLIISLVSIMEVESDPNYELKDNAGSTVVLFTLGGAAVGAMIGASMQKYTSYYVHMSKE